MVPITTAYMKVKALATWVMPNSIVYSWWEEILNKKDFCIYQLFSRQQANLRKRERTLMAKSRLVSFRSKFDWMRASGEFSWPNTERGMV